MTYTTVAAHQNTVRIYSDCLAADIAKGDYRNAALYGATIAKYAALAAECRAKLDAEHAAMAA